MSNVRPADMKRIDSLALANAFIDEQVALLREQIGDKKVLLALSGGVDSSVVAALFISPIFFILYLHFKLYHAKPRPTPVRSSPSPQSRLQFTSCNHTSSTFSFRVDTINTLIISHHARQS